MSGKIHGHGGGDSGPAQHVPYEAPDSLRSKATARIIDIISEGPIGGLVDGLKSFKLNGTPTQGPNDATGAATYNFHALNVQMRKGTQNQSAIGGFSSTEAEVGSGVEIKFQPSGGGGTPAVITIADSLIDRVRLLLSFQNGLSKSTTDGDLQGTTVDLKIEIRSAGGAWQLVRVERVTGKSTTRYQRSVTVDLNAHGVAPWDVRVSRLTADSATMQIVDKSYLASYTLVKDGKLRYPNTALVGVEADAISFSSIPVRSYVIRGMIVQVPSNYTPRDYDPATNTWSVATYTGSWDGNFKPMWTDNPAWCFYDLLTSNRYGLGEYLSAAQVDKWSLYNIAKYCDELVPDGLGLGGTEPRFTCNICLNSQEEAYQVVTGFAAIFRGMAYWAAGQVFSTQDRPTDPVYSFSESNVVDGMFTYSTASRKARHNVVLVAWNDPADSYRQKIEYVEDQDDIKNSGKIVDTQIVAMGCNSRSQAQRVGLWFLYTERYESEVVSFRTALENVLVMPGDRINVQDQSRVSTRMGGRLVAATTTSLTLDASVSLQVGHTYSIWCTLPDGTTVSKAVTNALPYTGVGLTIAALAEAPLTESQWVLAANDLAPQIFRVLHVKQVDKDNGEIVATKHDPSKFAYIDSHVSLDTVPDGTRDGRVAAPTPTGLLLGEFTYVAGTGVKTALSIGWDLNAASSEFGVEYRKDNGPWVVLPRTPGAYAEVVDIVTGEYTARVTAYSVKGAPSAPAYASLLVVGKTEAPANVTGLAVTYSAVGGTLSWSAVPDLDLDGYEVRMGASWAAAAFVSYGKTNSFVILNQVTQTNTYWVKAKDTSGNYSVGAASISVGSPSILGAGTMKLEMQAAWVTAQAAYAGVVAQAKRVYRNLDGTGGYAMEANALTAAYSALSSAATYWSDATVSTDLSAIAGVQYPNRTIPQRWADFDAELAKLKLNIAYRSAPMILAFTKNDATAALGRPPVEDEGAVTSANNYTPAAFAARFGVSPVAGHYGIVCTYFNGASYPLPAPSGGEVIP